MEVPSIPKEINIIHLTLEALIFTESTAITASSKFASEDRTGDKVSRASVASTQLSSWSPLNNLNVQEYAANTFIMLNGIHAAGFAFCKIYNIFFKIIFSS